MSSLAENPYTISGSSRVKLVRNLHKKALQSGVFRRLEGTFGHVILGCRSLARIFL